MIDLKPADHTELTALIDEHVRALPGDDEGRLAASRAAVSLARSATAGDPTATARIKGAALLLGAGPVALGDLRVLAEWSVKAALMGRGPANAKAGTGDARRWALRQGRAACGFDRGSADGRGIGHPTTFAGQP